MGEAMVLHSLTKLPLKRVALIKVAWQLGMDGFVARCAQNFPTLVETSDLLKPTPEALTSALVAAHTALTLREHSTGGNAAVAARGQKLLLDRAQPPAVRAFGAYMWQQTALDADAAGKWLEAIDELLATAFYDTLVRDNLANGLVNAIGRAETGDANTPKYLASLEALTNDKTVDSAIRKSSMAMGLFNSFNKAPANSEIAYGLLVRLEKLADGNKSDETVNQILASGLLNAIGRADPTDASTSRWLTRLQELADAKPADAAVRKCLARGFYNAFNSALANSAAAKALLERLQALADDYPADAAVREALVEALFNAFHDAPINSAVANALLDRLQVLEEAHPADVAVRKEFTKGLVHALSRIDLFDASTSRWLARLQALADAHPENVEMHQQLTKGLFNAFFNAPANTLEENALLARLNDLAEMFPTDAVVNKFAWKGSVTANEKSLDAHLVHPRHLIKMATLLSRLAGDNQVQVVTLAVIDQAFDLLAIVPEPLHSELGAALALLQQAHESTFPKNPLTPRSGSTHLREIINAFEPVWCSISLFQTSDTSCHVRSFLPLRLYHLPWPTLRHRSPIRVFPLLRSRRKSPLCFRVKKPSSRR